MMIIYAVRKEVDFYNGSYIEKRPLPKFKDLIWPAHKNFGLVLLECI